MGSQGTKGPRRHNLDAMAGALAVLDKLHDSATDSLAPHWQTSLEQLGDGQEWRKHTSHIYILGKHVCNFCIYKYCILKG